MEKWRLAIIVAATGWSLTVVAHQSAAQTANSPPAEPVAQEPAGPASDSVTEPKATSEQPGAKSPSGDTEPAAADAGPDSNPASQGTDDAPASSPPRADLWQTLEELTHSGALGELRRGGFFMWPILALAIVAAGVILERWRSLKMVGSDSSTIRGEVAQLLEQDRVEEALQTCDQAQGPVPYVLAVGLRKYLVLRQLGYDSAQISSQVVRSMDDHSVHIVAALEKHLPILATVSSVAPMLGFLGTVQGMVVSFREIVARMGETNIVEAAASGINMALLTTVFGLIVGIPTYIAYNYFTSVINGYVLQVEESATELIETVTLNMALQNVAAHEEP